MQCKCAQMIYYGLLKEVQDFNLERDFRIILFEKFTISTIIRTTFRVLAT